MNQKSFREEEDAVWDEFDNAVQQFQEEYDSACNAAFEAFTRHVRQKKGERKLRVARFLKRLNEQTAHQKELRDKKLREIQARARVALEAEKGSFAHS
jgi:beta-xylosidase